MGASQIVSCSEEPGLLRAPRASAIGWPPSSQPYLMAVLLLRCVGGEYSSATHGIWGSPLAVMAASKVTPQPWGDLRALRQAPYWEGKEKPALPLVLEWMGRGYSGKASRN